MIDRPSQSTGLGAYTTSPDRARGLRAARPLWCGCACALVLAGALVGCAETATPAEPGASTPGAPTTDEQPAEQVQAIRDAGATGSTAAAQRDAGTSSTTTADPGAQPATKVSCGGDTLCADFEDQTGTELSNGWSVVAPNCAGDGKITVDRQVAHGGKQALRITSSGGYCNHVFASPKLEPARLGGPHWMRWYMRVSEVLGDGHVTFLAMHDKVSGKDLRMGGQSRILMWNRERDDATLPELSPTGIGLSAPLAANTWQCLEVFLDGTRGSLETYLDGKRIAGLTVDQSPTADIDGQWLRPGAWKADVDDLRIGWESYGSQKMTLWIDDVVVASARPGC